MAWTAEPGKTAANTHNSHVGALVEIDGLELVALGNAILADELEEEVDVLHLHNDTHSTRCQNCLPKQTTSEMEANSVQQQTCLKARELVLTALTEPGFRTLASLQKLRSQHRKISDTKNSTTGGHFNSTRASSRI